MSLRRIAVAALFAAALAVAGGCLSFLSKPSNEPGAVVWGGGRLTKNYAVEFERTWTAASATIRDLKLMVNGERGDALVGRIDAQRADGAEVRVDVTRIGDKLTRVSVRVGFIGSREGAQQVMDILDKKIGD